MTMTEAQTLEYSEGISAYYQALLTGDGVPALPQTSKVWVVRGWRAAEEAGSMLPEKTPAWILTFLGTTPHGGWIQPIPLEAGHPLVTEEWTCAHCTELLAGGDDYAIIMPFHGNTVEDSKWVAYHRKCSMELLGLVPEADDA
jgi:hypothetical protein